MSAPPGLLASALLFWGWQTGLHVFAVPAAALAEGWRLTSRRFVFARTDFARVSDFSAALFFCMAAYLYFTRPADAAFMTLSAWLPLALLPMLVSQLYSARGVLDVRALFVFMRRWPEKPEWTADISYPFLLYCLIAAGAANTRSPAFFPATAALAAWGLWPARPRGSSFARWGALMALACALGYAGQERLARLQNAIETRAIELVFGGPKGGVDPEEAATSMGHIGKLKFSDRIALRLTVPAGGPPPKLLRAAAYDAYRGRRWLAWEPRFSPAAADGGSWRIAAKTAATARVDVAVSLEDGSGLLPAPGGTASIDGLAGGAVVVNALGAIKLEQGPGLASYAARFSDGGSIDARPGKLDLQVPEGDAALLTGIARRLKLDPRKPRRSLDALKDWFDRDFRYSLYREGPDPGAKALEEFLTETRGGHCEYFATAGALILRAAGIPARYAAGYSIQEYSRLEHAWVARDRHAHAWVLAYVDGRWLDFDPTPASWVAAEQARAPRLEKLRDALSFVSYRLARWRWSRSEGASSRKLVLILVALVALAAWKFAPSFRSAVGASSHENERRGRDFDSPWYAIERRFARDGLGRLPSETWRAWLARVKRPELSPLLALHERARFDPRGLSGDQQEALSSGVAAWLKSPSS